MPVPTLKQLKSAIYVDYEGRPHHRPVLLGTQIDGVYDGILVDRRYFDFVDRWGARRVTFVDHREFAKKLVERASSESRLLISWSEHDLRELSIALDGDRAAKRRLKDCFYNALTAAHWWGHQQTPAFYQPHTLARYAAATGYVVPERYGTNVVGKNLAALDKRLQTTSRYAELTTEERERWRTVVKHNKHDLSAMRHALIHIARHSQG